MTEKTHCLVGKVVNAVKLADDNGAILFATNDGDIVARADGDCCSHTWIEHVELPAMGFPFTVTAVEDLDLPHSDLTPEQAEEESTGELKFYGCKISTDKGDLVIDYRNSSNGYYGGNLSWPHDSYFYGGVSGQNISTQKWVNLTDVC